MKSDAVQQSTKSASSNDITTVENNAFPVYNAQDFEDYLASPSYQSLTSAISSRLSSFEETKRCSCGVQNRLKAKFCVECTKEFNSKCNCGEDISSLSKHCDQCGARNPFFSFGKRSADEVNN